MNTVNWRNAKPEQFVLFNKVLSLIGATPTWTELVYEGHFNGSEFETYNAKKLYLALELLFNSTGAVTGSAPAVTLYDNANAAFMSLSNCSVFYQAANQYFPNDCLQQNIWFSRLSRSVYADGKFNGYKVIWP